MLGQKDVRKVFQIKEENSAGQLLVKNKLGGKRYVRGISKTSKRIFINWKDSPVKNHLERFPG